MNPIRENDVEMISDKNDREVIISTRFKKETIVDNMKEALEDTINSLANYNDLSITRKITPIIISISILFSYFYCELDFNYNTKCVGYFENFLLFSQELVWIAYDCNQADLRDKFYIESEQYYYEEKSYSCGYFNSEPVFKFPCSVNETILGTPEVVTYNVTYYRQFYTDDYLPQYNDRGAVTDRIVMVSLLIVCIHFCASCFKVLEAQNISQSVKIGISVAIMPVISVLLTRNLEKKYNSEPMGMIMFSIMIGIVVSLISFNLMLFKLKTVKIIKAASMMMIMEDEQSISLFKNVDPTLTKLRLSSNSLELESLIIELRQRNNLLASISIIMILVFVHYTYFCKTNQYFRSSVYLSMMSVLQITFIVLQTSANFIDKINLLETGINVKFEIMPTTFGVMVSNQALMSIYFTAVVNLTTLIYINVSSKYDS